ncbi:ABC transporter ATP-binding protein [Arenibaculum pallidiluteum]|uniref:ABC transporter ATP-binding protein n=1 Tax=Arenibaculum pallidiluteum TaxID=2812559 RepID=UPI001A9628A2|nr:ABC transporter ATP-binding protein [Arenibaculum pallidiluteum]
MQVATSRAPDAVSSTGSARQHRDRPEGEILVRFSGVQKTYDGDHLAVRGLDLEIRKGEFLTLLGPSGSGKTTTLMMLAGFEVPTHGEILLDGRPITDVPPHRRDIGMVFQNYALFPHMTVAENVAFPLSVRGLGKAEIRERVERALGMVQLDGFGRRRPAQLSGGQQQRVALARALVFDPRLVLMDEPLGALDKRLREHMQIEIKHIHATTGITVVYVTHDQGEALTMSDRIAVFNDGAIQQIDRPEALYERPATSFVANFLGENNMLHGMVEAVEGRFCTVRLDGGQRVRALAVRAETCARTSLSLRPERALLGDGMQTGTNGLMGTVSEVIYLGDHSRILVSIPGNPDFMVKLPASAGMPPPAAGEPAMVAFAPEDCRALDPA